MNFLRNLLASILGTLTSVFILFFMSFFFLMLVGTNESKPKPIKDNSVLELSLSSIVQDKAPSSDSDPFSPMMNVTVGMDQLLLAIEAAKTDPKIKGISIRNNFMSAGISQLQRLRKALESFKESGKPIMAYADFYSQSSYYIASVADTVSLNSQGSLLLGGLTAEVMYYKDFQDKTGLKMEVIRQGEYKSAVEPYLFNEMSDQNREQLGLLLGGLWGAIGSDMASSRSMTVQQLDDLIRSLGTSNPNKALANGFVDVLQTKDQYDSMLKVKMNLSLPNKIKKVSVMDYASGLKRDSSQKDKVAVVYAQGAIEPGYGSHEYIGEKMMVNAIEKAAGRFSVKAIVLRIDSPGGSSLISENIYQALLKAKTKKPLVVSMGDVAASGGYYIALPGEKIFATPTTITGSIGVFGTIPNASELVEEIGINTELVSTHGAPLHYSPFSPMSDSFRTYMQESIAFVYQSFLERVSVSREMSVEQVDAIAQGRVWGAYDALKIGLIDEIGELEDAIAYAAEVADLDSYSVVDYPHYKSPFELFMEDLAGLSSSIKSFYTIKAKSEDPIELIQEFIKVPVEQHIYTELPYHLKID